MIKWYRRKGRTFYWRTHVLNGWQWLVLEILLRKTRAEAVDKIFPSLIAKYFGPTAVLAVSDGDLEDDLRILGLYRQRREILKRIATEIVDRYDGLTPAEEHSLASLPGIGPYITNAVLCFGHGERRAVVDINVARVLTPFQGMEIHRSAARKRLQELAEKMLPARNWKEYNYGLLDLGAVFCRSKTPSCLTCYLKDICSTGKAF